MLAQLLSSITALIYLVTGGLLGMRLARPYTILDSRILPLSLIAVAAGVHAWLLIHDVFVPEGVNLGFFIALSSTGWLVATVLLITALIRPVENLGIVLLPYSALTVMLAAWFPSQRIVESADQWPLELHIIISILAYSLLTLASVQAILLALQNQRLKQRNPGGFIRRLPPLTTMERLLFQLIRTGFVLLTLALLSGFLFLEDIFAQHLAHKTLLSLLAWLVFGILLWGRRHYGWRGVIAVRWTLSGFAVLVLAYFGSKFVLELILER